MSKKTEQAIKKNGADFFSRNRFEIILFSVTFLVFVNTVFNKYSLDDELVTERNTQVSQGISGMKAIFTSFYTEGSDTKYSFEYRPVVKATYAIEYSLFGFNPAISHLINVLLFAITVVVLFRFLSFLFKNSNPLFSFLVCLLFAVHPLHTEVVASLKNRDELLSFLFCLMTAKYTFDFLLNKKWLAVPLMIVCFLVAALSKEDAMVFLGLIPLMGIYFYRKEIKWILIVPAIILPAGVQGLMKKIAVNKVANDRVLNFHENPLFGDPNLAGRIAMAAKSFGFYLKIFFIPYPFCFYYGYNQVTIPSFTSLAFILPVLAGLFILWLIFKFFKSNPLLSFGLAFFVVSVAVYLNILVPVVGIVADRFDYVPSLGLCIAFVAALGMVFKTDFSKEKKLSFAKLGPALTYSIISICIVFSVYSIVRNRQWKSRMSLFAHDIKHLHNSAKANELLASEYSAEASRTKDPQERARYADSAIKYFRATLEIYPDYTTVHNNLGSIYFNMKGDISTPLNYFKKAIELDSNYSAAYQNLGMCLFRNKDTVNALKYLDIAVKKDKGKNPKVLLTQAQIFFWKKDFAKAEELLTTAEKKFPESDLPNIQKANFLMALKDTAAYIVQLEKAVEKKTQNQQVYEFLINHYSGKNPQKTQEYMNLLDNLKSNRNDE